MGNLPITLGIQVALIVDKRVCNHPETRTIEAITCLALVSIYFGCCSTRALPGHGCSTGQVRSS